MSYTDHINPEPETSKRRFDTTRLNEVTKVSKLLALVLFIFLPFGGFWLGLQHVPVVYVEAPTREFTSTTTQPVADDETTESSAATTTTGAGLLREHYDSEVGISFSYPVEWGIIQTTDEPGDCPPGYDTDSCVMRRYSVQDPASGDYAIFLVAATAGHGSYPVARGAFWGDLVHRSAMVDSEPCTNSDHCRVYENRVGLEFVSHASVPEGGDTGWYTLRRSSGDFTRFGLSAVNLNQVNINDADFAATVVNSFQIE